MAPEEKGGVGKSVTGKRVEWHKDGGGENNKQNIERNTNGMETRELLKVS